MNEPARAQRAPGRKPSPRPPASGPVLIDQAEFGRRFFAAAVTQQRVADAVQSVAGRPIEVGPFGVGPMRLVKVRATGEVGTATVEPRAGEDVSFDLTIPADLHLTIEMGLDTYRFNADVRIRLVLIARPADPLVIQIVVPPPTKNDVDVDVRAEGVRASVIQTIAGVDAEIKRAVAKFVRRELDKPALQKSMRVDVARALERISTPK